MKVFDHNHVIFLTNSGGRRRPFFFSWIFSLPSSTQLNEHCLMRFLEFKDNPEGKAQLPLQKNKREKRKKLRYDRK